MFVLLLLRSTNLVQNMAPDRQKATIEYCLHHSEVHGALDLKHTLQSLADERYLTLSAMMRVIASDYIKASSNGTFTIADEKKREGNQPKSDFQFAGFSSPQYAGA